jgi:hypothetical protein
VNHWVVEAFSPVSWVCYRGFAGASFLFVASVLFYKHFFVIFPPFLGKFSGSFGIVLTPETYSFGTIHFRGEILIFLLWGWVVGWIVCHMLGPVRVYGQVVYPSGYTFFALLIRSGGVHVKNPAGILVSAIFIRIAP